MPKLSIDQEVAAGLIRPEVEQRWYDNIAPTIRAYAKGQTSTYDVLRAVDCVNWEYIDRAPIEGGMLPSVYDARVEICPTDARTHTA